MKLHAIILAVGLSFGLAACGPHAATKGPSAPAPAATPQDLNIEIGRYSVMLDQVHSLTADRPGAVEAQPSEARELARRLRETVWTYNTERSDLCSKGLFTEVSCGPSFQPVWISEAPDAEPAFAELQSRSQAVGSEVQRFWDAVCADARTRETNEQDKMYVCAME